MNATLVDFDAALFTSDLKKLDELLANGFDVNQHTASGDTPFIAASRLANDRFVSRLIKHGADLEAKDTSNGQTALHVACLEGKAKRVRQLLVAGAKPSVRDDAGQSPLYLALIHEEKKYLAVVQELLRHGADPNEDKYESNLMVASRNSTPGCVRLLLDAGASINAVHPGGTALINAIIFHKNQIVELLIASGADPNLAVPSTSPETKIAGKDAFELAQLVGNSKAVTLLCEKFGPPSKAGQ